MSEKSLSEKIWDNGEEYVDNFDYPKLYVKDVKEAVKRLKEGIIRVYRSDEKKYQDSKMKRLIDEIFGKELTQ